jgi:glycosyltransferase involved in cell wall biosynthesis
LNDPLFHPFSPDRSMTADMKKLAILQVAPAVEGGGGEQISLRLHNAFRSLGYRSMLFAGRGSAAPDQDIRILPDRWQASRRGRFLYDLYRRILRFSGGRGETRLLPVFEAVMFPRFRWDLWRGNEDFTQPGSHALLSLAPEKPDVILLHNLHARWHRREGFFDLSFLESLSRNLPVILLPQDPWLLTGHCAHPIDCPRWRIGCGVCPDLHIYPSIRRDGTVYNWRRKHRIFSRSRLYAAPPSGWLGSMFAESGIRLAGMRVIANGVDPDVFQPGPVGPARGDLGLPLDRRIILVSGNSLQTNPWKGFPWLIDAARFLAGTPGVPTADFLCIGDEGGTQEFGQIRVVFGGRVSDPGHMAKLYRAADVYFHPSRADTAPFSVLEAMSSALPVTATRVGGIPEQVEEGVTGLLAPPGDSRSMADHLAALLSDPNHARSMGEAGRRRVLDRFTFSRQMDDLLGWIDELTDPRTSSRSG